MGLLVGAPSTEYWLLQIGMVPIISGVSDASAETASEQLRINLELQYYVLEGVLES